MLVRVKVAAGARKERFIELMEHSFDIHVKEKAERNEANRRVEILVARHYRVPEKDVKIISGHTRARKTIRVLK